MSIFHVTASATDLEKLKYITEAAKNTPPKEDVTGSVSESGLRLKNSIGLVHSTLCTVANLEALPNLAEYRKEIDEFLRRLKEVQYLEIKNMKIPTVEGLTVGYIPYIEVLKACIEHMKKVYAGVIRPYSTFLARFVSDDRMRKNHTQQSKIDYAHFQKMRDANYKALTGCLRKFNPKGKHELTQQPLSSVVRNNAEWGPILNKAESLVKDVISCDRGALDREVQTCAEYIEIIATDLKKNEKADITPAIYTDVITGAFNVAEEIEFFNTVWLLTFNYNAAVGEAAKTITNRLSMS